MAEQPTDKGHVPVWPTVEKQLAAAKVAPGSALEQLIRNNQDFHMLRPEEAHDQLPFPPWLRVYWRKAHPEMDYSGPRVGYPLFLKEICKWMLRNQDLPAGPAAGNSPQPSSTSGR